MKAVHFHLVDNVKDQNANKAWNDLKACYGSAATSRTIIEHLQEKIGGNIFLRSNYGVGVCEPVYHLQ